MSNQNHVSNNRTPASSKGSDSLPPLLSLLGSSLGLLLGRVGLNIELVEEVGEVDGVGLERGHDHTLGRVRTPVGGSDDDNANQELNDLSHGEVVLERGIVAEGGEHIVAVHQSVNEGVKADQHQASGGGGSDHHTPHDQHHSSMVVHLKKHRVSALENDNPITYNTALKLADMRLTRYQ